MTVKRRWGRAARLMCLLALLAAMAAVGSEVRSSASVSPNAIPAQRYLVFVGQLYGSQVVGGSNSPASGTATLVIDQTAQTLTTDARWSGLSGPADRAHIHSGVRGVGRTDFFFEDVGGDDSSTNRTVDCPFPAAYAHCLPTSGSLHDVADGSAGSYNCPDFPCIVQHAIPSGFFIDFHTQLYESGEMRGQLDRVTDFAANGSFEKPAGGSGTRSAGDAFDGWSINSGDVDIVGSTDGLWAAFAGSQSIDLNGTAPGSISQSIPTVAGVHYRISYEYAGNPDCGPAVKSMRIFWGGVPIGIRKFDTTGKSHASMGWVSQAIGVNASAGSSTTLTFTSLSPGGCGPVIDAVHVSPT